MDEYQRFRNWGRIGGLTAHSRHGSDVMLAGARRGFEARFLKLVDPTGELDPVERQARAERARRAHMLTLAAKSADARRKRTARVTETSRAVLEVRRATGDPPAAA